VVPGMGHTSLPWWFTQASARCDAVHPFMAAMALTRSNISAFFSIFSGWNRGRLWKQMQLNIWLEEECKILRYMSVQHLV
jgi:hypothetical protein